MPADRRNLRKQLAQTRENLGKQFVGFDFDCTLTTRHFFKSFAWGYLGGNPRVHEHAEELNKWCKENGVEFKYCGDEDEKRRDPMNAAIESMCRSAGVEKFHKCVREVFMGGDDRIKQVETWLERMKQDNVEFAIVTAGTATSVLRALAAVPEWQPYFPSDVIWDTQQGRHSIRSTAGHKCLMLRDIRPKATQIVLVDDSLPKDTPDDWVLSCGHVDIFPLEYEASGLTLQKLAEIEEMLGLSVKHRETGNAPFNRSATMA